MKQEKEIIRFRMLKPTNEKIFQLFDNLDSFDAGPTVSRMTDMIIEQ